MQRMYLQAWRLDRRPGVRGSVNAAIGLVALLLEIALLSLLRKLVRGLPLDWVLGAPLSLVASLALWTSIPWLLLDRRVPFRRLLPAGGLTAVAAGVYGVASTVYMPRTMETYSQRYGLFGVTVALVGWLLCSALILVAATVVAAEFDRAPEAWARRLRAGWRLGPDEPTADAAEAAAQPVLVPGEGRPAHEPADGHP
jgi:membrane protein